MSQQLTFTSELFLAGKTATGIVVPNEIVEALGAGRKPKVVVVLNGFSYRSSISNMGGEFMIPVAAAIRESANVTAGEMVVVQVSVDTEERKVEVPDDLRALLDANPTAAARFQSLSYSNQKHHVIQVESAKTPETRQRRLDKAMAELSEAK